jgi:hypothetical protein
MEKKKKEKKKKEKKKNGFEKMDLKTKRVASCSFGSKWVMTDINYLC